jgi:large subunit ribosomal protein L10
MKANLSKAAGLFNAPALQVARLAAALQEKRAAEEPAAPAEAPAAEAAAPEAPAAEAAETESTE